MPDNLREALRQAYDDGAHERDRADLPEWKRQERSRFLAQLQARKLTKLLDAGAGTGRDGRYFADAGCDVTCIDLSSVMVELCRKKGLRALIMDVVDLSFPASSFDAIYSMNSLLHLPKPELPGALRELRRILKPGGLFYIGTYGGYDYAGIYDNDDHSPRRFFSFYEDAQLKRVVGNAFTVLAFRSQKIDGNDPRVRFQSVLLQRQIDR